MMLGNIRTSQKDFFVIQILPFRALITVHLLVSSRCEELGEFLYCDIGGPLTSTSDHALPDPRRQFPLYMRQFIPPVNQDNGRIII